MTGADVSSPATAVICSDRGDAFQLSARREYETGLRVAPDENRVLHRRQWPLGDPSRSGEPVGELIGTEPVLKLQVR